MVCPFFMAGVGCRVVGAILGMGLLALFGFFMCLMVVWGGISREVDFRHQFGASWQEEFEKVNGSMASAHTKIGFGLVGLVAIPTAAVWVIQVLNPKQHSGRSRRRRRSDSRSRLSSWLVAPRNYRRNGTLAICLGLQAIAVSVLLVVFRLGLFEHHSDEVILGVGVFIPGYVLVLTGCRWWLKAKDWNDAVIFIGMMPLAVFFVPYVRLLYLAAPMLLPVGMVFMTLILVVIVVVLPDKNRSSRRRSHWDRDDY